MPVSELHKKKRLKNLAILGAIAAWAGIIFAVTVIRMH
ncbi:MAG: hypothetical protein JWO78_910 [Micavibrio sp.]|nr:hypothetical protein [Micavibrio sp.]